MHGLNRLYEESQCKVAGPGKPAAKLHAFITHLVRFYEEYPYFLELIQRIENSSSAASTTALQNIRTQFYHLVTDLITQFNDEQHEKPLHPEWAALALLGIIRGILRFTPQPWPKHLPDWIFQQFMQGLSISSHERRNSGTRRPISRSRKTAALSCNWPLISRAIGYPLKAHASLHLANRIVFVLAHPLHQRFPDDGADARCRILEGPTSSSPRGRRPS